MGERIELRVHDFLVEGRDESKSHVLVEIAEPSPNEVSTHGHFFAIAELSGATPKTIQMVRAWIEFAIDTYYKSVPTNIELHFETIMGLLNTQSSLYLKQHANEIIHIAIASVCNGALYLAVHGRPTALLLYNKDGGWHTMDLVDETAMDSPGQLFSNVVTGVMRVDDRFLIATPRVIEFFSADRLTKISEGKTLEEVTEHMQRVLSEMSSDYSFAAVWLRLVRAFDETKEIMQHKVAPPEQPAPVQRIEKKADASMTELFNKAKSTAAILAPPVLTIPKDKIITNILKLAQRSMTTSGKAVVSATQTSISYLKTERGRAAIEKINQKISPRSYLENLQQQLISNFSALPIKRKQTLMIAVGGVVVALGFLQRLASFIFNLLQIKKFRQSSRRLKTRFMLRTNHLYTKMNLQLARVSRMRKTYLQRFQKAFVTVQPAQQHIQN
ncbi:MAG: hypothetical protein NT003_04005 [Candidatus Magasanikbacteria bacterium]|nr:hypothetical protein [Candidatus Magasanikbacteria bacterium]